MGSRRGLFEWLRHFSTWYRCIGYNSAFGEEPPESYCTPYALKLAQYVTLRYVRMYRYRTAGVKGTLSTMASSIHLRQADYSTATLNCDGAYYEDTSDDCLVSGSVRIPRCF